MLHESFRSKQMQLIYSSMNIEETARSSSRQFHVQMTNALEEMNGAYLHQSTLHFDKSPRQQLEECIAAQKDSFNQVTASMRQILHKFFGGQKDKDLRQVVNEQHNAFAGLINHMSECIEALEKEGSDGASEYLPMLKMLPEIYMQQFENNTQKMLQRFEADFPSSVNFNAAVRLRGKNKIDCKSLDEIAQPPQVMQKIWAQVNSSGKTFSSFKTANEFLVGLFQATGEQLTTEAKILVLYNLLSLIGYQADEKLGNDGKFRSAVSDHTHAVCGAYAHIFITHDIRMARKLFAIYEYLEIKTRVCLGKRDEQGQFTLLAGKDIFF